MSISNYAELQTAIGNWLHRGDLTTIIPDFITLAESKLNRRLRLRSMENTATGTVAQTVSLPTGYVGMRSLTVSSGSTSYPLTYIPPSSVHGNNDEPLSYSIIGDSIHFEPYSSSYTYSLTYYKAFAALSAGVNWLITNAPDVYLYATLLESAPYLKNDSRITTWEHILYGDPNDQSKKGILQQLEDSDRQDRYGSDLVVKVC